MLLAVWLTRKTLWCLYLIFGRQAQQACRTVRIKVVGRRTPLTNEDISAVLVLRVPGQLVLDAQSRFRLVQPLDSLHVTTYTRVENLTYAATWL